MEKSTRERRIFGLSCTG